MKISGFTMVRNAETYYFPIKESIESILPIVDEFIVALGKGNDNTKEIIESIDSDKVLIYEREWDESSFVDGKIFRDETNFALSKCRGDWCFYLQADEIVHEKYLDIIVNMCNKYLKKDEIEGFLFKYKHFWGDYDHFVDSHSAYPNEIRLIKNHIGIYSYRDAQSFRIDNDRKINVVEIPAYIYHYGWVRPPKIMTNKKKEQDSMHIGKEKTAEKYENSEEYLDYGPLGRLPEFNGTHPSVMTDLIDRFNWSDYLYYGKHLNVNRELFKHERLKYRIITFLEKHLFGGQQLGGFKNYNLIYKEN